MKSNKKIIICGVLSLFLIVASILLANVNKTTIQISSNLVLSNTKIGWGIKREKEHKQPDLGSKNKALIEKYNGIAMGKSDTKNVYLTFDNGYEAGYTAKILDVLKENNVKATFFITAHYANSAPELLQRMIEEGHIVR